MPTPLISMKDKKSFIKGDSKFDNISDVGNMWKVSLLFSLLLFMAIVAIAFANGSSDDPKSNVKNIRLFDDLSEDSLLDCSQLIKKYGYTMETHEVQTEDGYLVTIHRIPNGRVDGQNKKNATNRIPVLLMHGFTSSSIDWIINGPQKSFGYILADEGYDVWLTNARGNFYSKKHTYLNTSDPNFWRFSWNEIGYYDLPATIDYILNVTGHPKLHYVGHSQGTTVFFVMASERPEMNDKILSMQAFAPVAYVTNTQVLYPVAAPFVDEIEKLVEYLGVYEIFPITKIRPYLAYLMCNENSKYFPFCLTIATSFGNNTEQLNMTMIPVYLSHTPAGASVKQFIHYTQMVIPEKFQKYDFGEKNLEIYGSKTPPEYNLSLITSPVALHYGLNDLAAHPTDVFRLNSELGNSLGTFEVPMEKFNHLDFLWAIDAPTLLYNRVLDIMKDNNN